MVIQLVLRIMLVFVTIQEASAQMLSIALPGCPENCSNIDIPYPFGIGAKCSANSNFTITCNNSYTPPTPFLGDLKVLEISIYEGSIRVSDSVIQNARQQRYIFSDNQTQSTTVMDWYTSLKCDARFPTTNNSSFSLCGNNTSCLYNGLCGCKYGYEGNPYTPAGCQDVNECSPEYRSWPNIAGPTYYYIPCSQECLNEPGGYSCYCSSGYKLDGDGHRCYPDNKTRTAIIGIGSGIGGLILLGVTWWLYKLLQRIKEKKLKEKFFKKNGGLLLQQQISSSEGNIEKTKLFTSKELEKATDNYNKDRILGQGGQGTVYKGMLTDGRIVAVKKSKIEDESELEPFINEVVILSKIDHRNIVKLHGCCLEMEVPLLVYEFIPNGTLFQYIHEQNEDFPLSWDVRVRVAKEVAGALFYL